MEREAQVWNVSEVNRAVREIVENSLMPFWLGGEVGTLSAHRSGHVYLTLKDRDSQLKAVYFGGAAQARAMDLRVGMEVEAFGKLTVYEVRGEYQFSIRTLRPVGVGVLQRKFEEMRARLEAEGLFAPERKRQIPAMPRRIGVVTSADGAAIRDFLQIIERRFPNLNIRIYPAPVQGTGAEFKLARGVEFFNRHDGVDVIVITRGGGSMEDLWPFNTEVLARAVAASHIPVISAVGHEIDYSICDFVADLRVPTPSAAAELVIGRQEEYQQRLTRATRGMNSAASRVMERLRHRLERLSGAYAFREVPHLLRRRQQQTDELTEELLKAPGRALERKRHDLERLVLRFGAIKPKARLERERERMIRLEAVLEDNSRRGLERRRAALDTVSARLAALNPGEVLKRGYSILRDGSGRVLSSVAALSPGMKLNAEMSDGSATLKVDSVD